MAILFLAVSLLLMLFSLALTDPALFAVSIVSAIVSLSAIRFVAFWPQFSLWVWLNLVILYLISDSSSPVSTGQEIRIVFGIPVPALLMLVGIWIVPLILWPLGFLLSFRRWMDQ